MSKVKKVNKHGLPRRIPEDVRRVVRQRSGFGCVICGSGVIQYEHVLPEYCDAVTHDPECITLLCPSCHGKVTTKFWSKQKVLNAMKEPAAKKEGYVRDFFDFCGPHPTLRLGGVTFIKCRAPIEIFDRAIIKIDYPREPGSPFLLSGTFCDSNGNITLEIVENEWCASSELWDLEVARGTITIRHGAGDIVLRLKVLPPHTVVVDRLVMQYGPIGLSTTGDTLKITSPDFIGDLSSCLTYDCTTGISFYSSKPSTNPKLNVLTKILRSLQVPDPWRRDLL